MSSAVAEPMASDKPVVSPINTDTIALPTPDPSTTTSTAAKKRKKKKKKASQDGGASLAEDEEDDPVTPTADNNSKSDLPPTPITPGMQSNEFMPLTEASPPASPPAEEDLSTPIEATKQENAEHTPEATPEPDSTKEDDALVVAATATGSGEELKKEDEAIPETAVVEETKDAPKDAPETVEDLAPAGPAPAPSPIAHEESEPSKTGETATSDVKDEEPVAPETSESSDPEKVAEPLMAEPPVEAETAKEEEATSFEAENKVDESIIEPLPLTEEAPTPAPEVIAEEPEKVEEEPKAESSVEDAAPFEEPKEIPESAESETESIKDAEPEVAKAEEPETKEPELVPTETSESKLELEAVVDTEEVDEVPKDAVEESKPEPAAAPTEKAEEPVPAIEDHEVAPAVAEVEEVAESAKEVEEPVKEVAEPTKEPEATTVVAEGAEEESLKGSEPATAVGEPVAEVSEEPETEPEAVKEVTEPVEEAKEESTKEPECTAVVAEEPAVKTEEPVAESSKEPEAEAIQDAQSKTEHEGVKAAEPIEDSKAEPESASTEESVSAEAEAHAEPKAEDDVNETRADETVVEEEVAPVKEAEAKPEEPVAEKAAEPLEEKEAKLEPAQTEEAAPTVTETHEEAPKEEVAAPVEAVNEPESDAPAEAKEPAVEGKEPEVEAKEPEVETKEPEALDETKPEPETVAEIPKDEAKDEEDDVVLVDHDEAKPEDVAAAEAAVIPPPAAEPEVEERKEDTEASEKVEEDEKPVEKTAESEEDSTVQVNPLPASEGGENAPPEAATASIDDHVTLDKEAYESSEPQVHQKIAEDLSQEVKADPLPASEGGVNVAPEVGTASVDDHVTLDKETYESSEPQVHQDIAENPSEEVKVNPLPASDNGVNAAPEVGIASIDDHVTLDKESYESSEPQVHQEIAEPVEAEDLSKEVNVDPLPASEGGVNVPPEVGTASVEGHVALDKEAYESSEPQVYQEIPAAVETEDLSQEVKIDPLPASENGVNTAPEIGTASVEDHVTLDKESYESTEPQVPQEIAEPVEVEDLSKEVKVDPLPASEGGANIAPEVGAASVDDHVTLGKEAYESSEPQVPVILGDEKPAGTPVEEVAETATEVADAAEKIDASEPEVSISPLPVSEGGANAPPEASTAAIDEHVTLDREAYESSEPQVPVILEEEKPTGTPIEEVAETAAEVADTAEQLDAQEPEVSVSPLPASEGGANAAPEVGATSIDDHVTLDRATYESSEPQVPVIFEENKPVGTPIEEISETAVEVADTAEAPESEVTVNPLPASEGGENATEVGSTSIDKHVTLDKEAYESTEPQVPIVLSATEEAMESTEPEAAKDESIQVEETIVPTITAEPIPTFPAVVSMSEHTAEPISTDRSATLEEPVEAAEETNPSSQKVTEILDESTAHKKPEEELITEPAPQPSGVHGETVAVEDVPKALEAQAATEVTIPTVIVRSPTIDNAAESSEPNRTVEIVQPTPQENSPEGIRKRRAVGEEGSNRPTSRGSDVISNKRNKSFLFSFWHLFAFGWLGGMGRFFGGIFQSKKNKSGNNAAR